MTNFITRFYRWFCVDKGRHVDLSHIARDLDNRRIRRNALLAMGYQPVSTDEPQSPPPAGGSSVKPPQMVSKTKYQDGRMRWQKDPLPEEMSPQSSIFPHFDVKAPTPSVTEFVKQESTIEIPMPLGVTPPPDVTFQVSIPPLLSRVESYGCSLVAEEIGEINIVTGAILQLLGKAGRFGLDTPGVKDPLTGQVDMKVTPRSKLTEECGDFMAAIRYCCYKGIMDYDAVRARADTKFNKLTDPNSKDNLGNQLAP